MKYLSILILASSCSSDICDNVTTSTCPTPASMVAPDNFTRAYATEDGQMIDGSSVHFTIGTYVEGPFVYAYCRRDEDVAFGTLTLTACHSVEEEETETTHIWAIPYLATAILPTLHEKNNYENSMHQRPTL